MNAGSTRSSSHRRYRRRIVGWGAAAVLGIGIVGGVIAVNRAEDDLETRVNGVLVASAVSGVTTRFSGQNGELRCLDGPVSIPIDVVTEARGLWGVSSLAVASSCDPSLGDSGRTVSTDVAVSTDASAPGSSDESDAATTSSDAANDLDTVADVIANDSQFSTFNALLADAGLIDTLAGDGPFTVFAPTDAAFEALGPDLTSALERDPALLRMILSHHVTAGRLAAADLSAQDIVMSDGSNVTLGAGRPDATAVLTSGVTTATFTEADLLASNGVVHAIDGVLVPDSVSIGVDGTGSLITASVVDGQIVLVGSVANESQRVELVAAAGVGVDSANVVDQLTIDPSSVVGIDTLSNVVSRMAPNLVSGAATLTPDGLTVTGVYPTDVERADLEVAGAPGVTFDLTARADATDADAATLSTDLDALVAADPILFDPGSTTISTDSSATLDRVAAVAQRYGSVVIEVQGFTDTDGLAASNQALSDGRAQAVRTAMIERGIDESTLSAIGFGAQFPVLDGSGVEDKVASRRVKFVVTVP